MARRATKFDIKKIALAGAGGAASGLVRSAVEGLDFFEGDEMLVNVAVTAAGALVAAQGKEMEFIGLGMIGAGANNLANSMTSTLNGTSTVMNNGLTMAQKKAIRNRLAMQAPVNGMTSTVGAGMNGATSTIHRKTTVDNSKKYLAGIGGL